MVNDNLNIANGGTQSSIGVFHTISNLLTYGLTFLFAVSVPAFNDDTTLLSQKDFQILGIVILIGLLVLFFSEVASVVCIF